MTPTSATERRPIPSRDQFLLERQRGFTLLELMVVLTIVLIAAGLVVPRLSVLESKSFDAEVRQAVALLNYNRRLAIVEGVPQTAHFVALDARDKTAADKQAKLQAAHPTSQWSSGNLQLQFHRELNQKDGKRENADITFFPQGGSTGGVLEFSQKEFSARVRVDPITGRITAAWRGEELPQEDSGAKNQ